MQGRIRELYAKALEFRDIEDYAERRVKGMWLNERLIDLHEEGVSAEDMPSFQAVVTILVDEIMEAPTTADEELKAMRRDAQTNSGLYLP